jgi:predicted membrane channel-forming protein YqfA (hemolysin III family)
MVNFLGAVSAEGAAPELIWTLGGVAFWVAAVIYLFRPESMTFFTESKKRS